MIFIHHVEISEFDEVLIVKEEKDLISAFICLIFKFDPDIIYGKTNFFFYKILLGFDTEKSSLYYIAKRAKFYNINLTDCISRAPKDIEEVFVRLNFSFFEFHPTRNLWCLIMFNLMKVFEHL